MTVNSRVQTATGQSYQSRALMARSDAVVEELPAAQLYELLKWYYLNNGLYDDLTAGLYNASIWSEGMKPLRNPSFRAVEFYVSKLWPGRLPAALEVEAANPAIIPAIEKLWIWSNWSQQKQVAARWFAMYGDLFIKAVTKTDAVGDPVSVYLQLLEPQRLTDFDVDERGFITYARIDTPRIRRDGDETTAVTHTEVWSKAEDRFRVWEHKKSASTEISKLGPPAVDRKISDFGIDFVPISHGKFRDVGEKRGMSAITHALDKIDEANRQATRLHQILFRYNKATEALEGAGPDAAGRPLPPPKVRSRTDSYDDNDTIKVGDDRMIRLPSGWKWTQTVPQLDYKAALDTVTAQMDELERDLPELAYYRLRNMGEISGVAVRYLLSDAIDRALEARGNGEDAIAQAVAMALTLGSEAGLFGEIGSYDAGDFTHNYAERPVIVVSQKERAETMKLERESTVPLVTAARRAGWTEEEITAMLADAKAEAAQAKDYAEQLRADAERAFNAGEDVETDDDETEEVEA